MKGVAQGYEFLARIVMMVCVVNIAFILHTVVGAILLGFFPSLAATYATFRTWALSEDRSWTMKQTWKTFHAAWTEELVSANKFGWPQLVLGVFLVWDYYLANWNYMGVLGIAVSGILLLVLVFFGLFFLVSWTVRSNFAESAWWVMRMSLRMIFGRLWCSLMIVVLMGLTVLLWVKWPGIFMAFGFAVPLFAVVMTVYSFGRLPGMDAKAELGSRTM